MSEESVSQNNNMGFRRRLGLVISFLGLLLFFFGADPGLFGLDRSPVIGYVQVSAFSIALGVLCLGGTFALSSLWPRGRMSLLADFGLRVVWTGFVVSLASGMADLLGLGTRPFSVGTPFFGYWQERGVLLGEIVILIGFLMMVPFRKPEQNGVTKTD